MSLDKSLISHASRQLWPLPTFVIPGALGLCFTVPDSFSSTLIALIILLCIAQVVISILVWKSWKGTQDQLTGVKHELSSLLGIVDVSRDAIIGVTTEGVIMRDRRAKHENRVVDSRSKQFVETYGNGVS